MRTLEEMKNELNQISANLETIAQIASLDRPYNSLDSSTWNIIVPSTADRIVSLRSDIEESANSVGVYIESLEIGIETRRVSTNDARTEFNRAAPVCEALIELAEAIEDRAVRFDAYQRQVLNRTQKNH
ncbi:hypothetical protein IKE71_01585 [Candidatus Saccharibacteria bacterium]|nr:hypothetical protein [Candidatus Saccharibacteria bacterium]